MKTKLLTSFWNVLARALPRCGRVLHVLGLLLAVAGPAQAITSIERIGQAACESAESVRPRSAVARPWGRDEDRLFRFEASASEVMTVDLSTPTWGGEARLSLACGVADHVEVLWRSRRTLVLYLEQAGAVAVSVEAQDAWWPPASFVLRSTVAAERFPTSAPIALESDPPAICGPQAPRVNADDGFAIERRLMIEKDVEPWECDVLECRIGSFGGWRMLAIEAEGAPLQVSVFHGRGCSASTRLSGGILSRPGDVLWVAVPPGDSWAVVDVLGGGDVAYRLTGRAFRLCGPIAGDDHGDTPFCASLTEPGTFSGALTPASGDREDFLFFTVEGLSEARIALSEGILALERFDGGSVGAMEAGAEPAFMTKTLEPGHYVLRIANPTSMPMHYDGDLAIEPLP